MSHRWLVYGEMALAMVLVGSSVVVGKLIIASFPVFLASFLRLAISLPILGFVARESLYEFRTLSRRTVFLVFLQAFTGNFLFNALILYALFYTTAIESGIITSMTPAIIGVISWRFLRERLPRPVALGILITVAGILAINFPVGDLSTERGPDPLLGNILVFFAVIGEALFTIFRKVTAHELSGFASAVLVTIFGLVCFAIPAAIEALDFSWSGLTMRDLLIMLYFALSVNVIGYIFWFRSVGKVPASTAGVFTGVLPLSVVILSAVVLGEHIGLPHILGMGCVMAGIGLVTRS